MLLAVQCLDHGLLAFRQSSIRLPREACWWPNVAILLPQIEPHLLSYR